MRIQTFAFVSSFVVLAGCGPRVNNGHLGRYDLSGSLTGSQTPVAGKVTISEGTQNDLVVEFPGLTQLKATATGESTFLISSQPASASDSGGTKQGKASGSGSFDNSRLTLTLTLESDAGVRTYQMQGPRG